MPDAPSQLAFLARSYTASAEKTQRCRNIEGSLKIALQTSISVRGKFLNYDLGRFVSGLSNTAVFRARCAKPRNSHRSAAKVGACRRRQLLRFLGVHRLRRVWKLRKPRP